MSLIFNYFRCNKCGDPTIAIQFDKIRIQSPEPKKTLFDDRMHTSCTLKGKHRCEDLDEVENGVKGSKFSKFKRACHTSASNCQPSTSRCPDRSKLDVFRGSVQCLLQHYLETEPGTSSNSYGSMSCRDSENQNGSSELEQVLKKRQEGKLSSAEDKKVIIFIPNCKCNLKRLGRRQKP